MPRLAEMRLGHLVELAGREGGRAGEGGDHRGLECFETDVSVVQGNGLVRGGLEARFVAQRLSGEDEGEDGDEELGEIGVGGVPGLAGPGAEEGEADWRREGGREGGVKMCEFLFLFLRLRGLILVRGEGGREGEGGRDR
jgi:hypothetical protein